MGGVQNYLSSHLFAMLERRSVCSTYPLILRFEGLDSTGIETHREVKPYDQ